MNTLVMNIGLNVEGLFSPQQELKSRGEVTNIFGQEYDYKILTASGDWGEEETLVVKIELSENSQFEQLVYIMYKLCDTLEQDAIAYKVGNVGYMAFNSTYSGERFEFNEQYFINL